LFSFWESFALFSTTFTQQKSSFFYIFQSSAAKKERCLIANAFGPVGLMIESPGSIARASCSHSASLSQYSRLLNTKQSSGVKKRALCNLSVCTFSMKCIRLGGWQHCSLDFFVVGVSYRVLSSCSQCFLWSVFYGQFSECFLWSVFYGQFSEVHMVFVEDKEICFSNSNSWMQNYYCGELIRCAEM
jgi:hypothetical protein